jgi:hypothetical protein
MLLLSFPAFSPAHLPSILPPLRNKACVAAAILDSELMRVNPLFQSADLAPKYLPQVAIVMSLGLHPPTATEDTDGYLDLPLSSDPDSE